MSEDWESWASIIRSCLCSSKTPLTPMEINKDVRTLEGKNIPYRQAFGYNTLEEMLRNIADLRVFQQNGQLVVSVVQNEKTSHIQKMVRFQKQKKKKPRTLPSFYNKNQYYVKKKNYETVPQNRHNTQQQGNKFSAPNYSYNRTTSLPNAHSWQTPQQSKPPPVSIPPKPIIPSSVAPLLSATPAALRQPITTQRPLSNKTSVPSIPSVPPVQKQSKTPQAIEIQKPLSVQQRLQQVQVTAPVPLSAPVILQTNTEKPEEKFKFLNNSQNVPKPKILNVSERLVAAKNGTSVLPFLSDDPRLNLLKYTTVRGLKEPIYKDIGPTKADKNIYSSVLIEKDKKYSSYPQEAKTKDEAEKIAARLALEKLLLEEKSPKVITLDINLMIKRVIKIVNEHPTGGMTEIGVVDVYKKQFNEGLPHEWLKYVENDIKVEKTLSVQDMCILYPRKESMPTLISPVLPSEPDSVRYQDLEEFYLHVYVAYSVTEIWGIINDENYSDQILELSYLMGDFYSKNVAMVSQIANGSYYAVFDNEWHRVRCLKYDEQTKEVTVWFIDRGDEDVYPANRLRPLAPEFCTLPAQAVRVSMEGLELFDDLADITNDLDDLLLEKDILVINKTLDTDSVSNRNQNVLSAELLLTSDGDIQIRLNDHVRDIILKKIDPTYHLSSDKVSQEAYISCVTVDAVYVQLASKGKKQLDELIKNVAKEFLDNVYFKPRPVLSLNPSKLYMAKSVADKLWHRVKLIKIINDDEARAFCVDEGDEMTVKKTELVSLEDLPELLSLFPHQAVRVILYKIGNSPITFDEKVVNRLRQLAPKTEIFYMKVFDVWENVPVVVFYKRTKENNLLASLNDNLVVGMELSSKDSNNNNNTKRIRNEKSSVETKSDFPLESPNIPAIGKEFDVYVTMAAHPSNFTVQPLSSAKALENLMTELSRVCNKYTGPPLTFNNVKPGNIYAAKYDGDSRWYRGYASKILNKSICVIYYCDYGDFRTVTMDQLQPLDKKFLSLPYQAIKAKLYGITPVLNDWSVGDSLRFRDLTVEKSFVSIVKSQELDCTNVNEIILGLELVNTSSSENIYISNILVKEKRAEKKVFTSET